MESMKCKNYVRRIIIETTDVLLLSSLIHYRDDGVLDCRAV
jgi:hypothetical protein